MTLYKTELKIGMEGQQAAIQGCDSKLKDNIGEEKKL
jgi:hypothetical protein